MDMSLVSIIMPAFQAAATIRGALRSVAAQTVRHWDIVVVDDASRDGTADIAVHELQALGLTEIGRRESPNDQGRPGFRVLRLPENMGPAAARNRGLVEARGDWIAFLDADDAWRSDRLEAQLALAGCHPDVVLWCGEASPLEEEDGDRSFPRSGGGDGNRAGDGIDTEGIRPLPLQEFAKHNPVISSTVLVRRDALAMVGGFDPQFRGPEDYDLWMRLASRFRLAMVERPLAYYRVRAGSLSMDERTFLPQARRVLDKAFGPGGVMAGHPEWRRPALANQYWNASWMAFQRGARGRALGLLCTALFRDSGVGRGRRLSLLWRYLWGRP